MVWPLWSPFGARSDPDGVRISRESGDKVMNLSGNGSLPASIENTVNYSMKL